MAMLKLAIADGRPLVIPSNSLRTIQGQEPLERYPDGRCAIRYTFGPALKVAVLMQSVDELRAMIAADRAARQDWIEVELAGGHPLMFLPEQLTAAGVQNPERPEDPSDPAQAGRNLALALDVEGAAITCYALGDADSVIAHLAGPQEQAPTPPSPAVPPTRRPTRRAPGRKE